MSKTRVLIVDDAEVVRQVLTEILSLDPSIEVVGTAVDPYDAREKIKQLRPDVITLDIEMPRMDGITFLKNLMKLNPMPVVMLSSLTHAGADATLQALELGAVDYIAKPTLAESDQALKQFQEELVGKVKTAAASAAKLKFKRSQKANTATPIKALSHVAVDNVIAIGASTGGTEALHEILEVLPDNMPPIVVTQHIPASFSQRFANRLNRQCKLTVQEAKHNDLLQPGHVYIAPGDHHLKVERHGHQLVCKLDDGEAVNRHKPSVEVMFDSLLGYDCRKVISVMLTGMGEDGALAMKALSDAGARCIVQDEASSLVWGMPGAAFKAGVIDEVQPLGKIAARLVKHLS